MLTSMMITMMMLWLGWMVSYRLARDIVASKSCSISVAIVVAPASALTISSILRRLGSENDEGGDFSLSQFLLTNDSISLWHGRNSKLIILYTEINQLNKRQSFIILPCCVSKVFGSTEWLRRLWRRWYIHTISSKSIECEEKYIWKLLQNYIEILNWRILNASK